MAELALPVIGYMHAPYREKFGIPRQPNLVQVESYIDMLPPYNNPLAFEGIDAFSHLWLIWQFHENKSQNSTQFRPQVRPPRLGGNQKIGVFATRSMYRPAPIGLSVVQLKEIRQIGDALRVYVTGSDLLDGTPILDIKPYIQYADAVMSAESGYAQQAPVRKTVRWNADAAHIKQQFLLNQKIEAHVLNELEEVLSLDPRPAYQDDVTRIYGLSFSIFNVKFQVVGDIVNIVDLEITA